MNKGRILVIDDEEIIRESCRRVLEPAGYKVETAISGGEGLQMLQTGVVDLVLTDLKMPDIDGIGVLIKIKEKWPDTEVIIMTGYGTVKTAVKAMKMGVFDYIEKPFSPDDLLALVARALNRQKLPYGEVARREIVPSHYELGNMVGISQVMQKVFQLIARVASTGSTVLITGESGTGKELIARAIHYNSPRKDLPFVVVDCNTIPETLIESELFGHVKGAFTGASETKKGLLEMANGGTIFLDEIGNLNISTQAKLLRILQEREFRPVGEKKTVHIDVRFIAATNKDLRIMTKEGSFREDLFYRLNIFPIHTPPLRDRKEDIPHLAQHFLEKYSADLNKRVTHISAEAMRLLVIYPWPGNVRQLENTIQRAVIMCQDKTLKPEHLTSLEFPSEEAIPRNSEELKEIKKGLRIKSVEGVEKAFIMEALRRNDWNISRASADVGMQRTNFHSLMKKYHISAKTAEEE